MIKVRFVLSLWIGGRWSELQIPRLRSEAVTFLIPWPESSGKHLPTSIAVSQRLRRGITVELEAEIVEE
jgi:hypothetical protein